MQRLYLYVCSACSPFTLQLCLSIQTQATVTLGLVNPYRLGDLEESTLKIQYTSINPRDTQWRDQLSSTLHPPLLFNWVSQSSTCLDTKASG